MYPNDSEDVPIAQSDVTPLVLLWMLRILVPMGGHSKFIKRHSFSDDRIAHAIGLGQLIDAEVGEFITPVVKSKMRQLHLQLEAEATQQPAKYRPDPQLTTNIDHLTELMGLNPIEQQILSLAVHLHTNRLLDDTADLLGVQSSAKTIRNIADLLGLPIQGVRTALGSQGILARSGLVYLDQRNLCPLRGKLELLSNAFADTMTAFDVDPLALLTQTVTLSAPPDLELADYPHMSRTLEVLQPFLKNATETKRKGVNIFIHGQPGTGKTQLVKCLAAGFGMPLFEVAIERESGEPVIGSSRLRAYRAAQSLLSSRSAFILFDEVEDVFKDEDGHTGRSTAQIRKAWVNRTLEENPVPAFWLSNSVDCLDPAFVRRFDLIFELPVPPRSQRNRMLDTQCAHLVSAHTRARIAENTQLAPGIVSKAVSVIQTVASDLSPTGLEAAFELLLGNTLKAQGHQYPMRGKTSVNDEFDPMCTHVDADLASITHHLIHAQSGRLCLYGPPGTGKTAFGHWLARQLDKPLILKRASDLMSKFVGETEKNLAQAFREAECEGAVLLIDEVDSFLQSRESASRSWEVTQVNEFLTQLEVFDGIFIATTNLMGHLDAAALRRFDLKIKFNHLRPEQSQLLLERHCQRLTAQQGEPIVPTHLSVERVRQLPNLTPGDFAAVLRQSRFRPLDSATAFVKALEDECALKPSACKPAIGFLAN